MEKKIVQMLVFLQLVVVIAIELVEVTLQFLVVVVILLLVILLVYLVVTYVIHKRVLLWLTTLLWATL